MAKPKGIRKHRGGYEVRWTDAAGERRTRRFPLETPLSELTTFREKELAKVTLAGPVVQRGTFEFERDAFLKTIPEKTRRHEDFTEKLRAWEPFLKGQRLHSVETAAVNRILQQWQVEGRSPATLMRLRSALMSLFVNRAPDLKPNPVADSMSFKLPKPKARALDLTEVSRIFAKMPTCATKARMMFVFYFGARPSEIMRLRVRDIVLDGEMPHVFIRSSDVNSEGKGTKDRVLPIQSDPQKDAAKMFVSTNAFGEYSTGAARKSFLLAAERAGMTTDDLVEGKSRLGRNRYRVRPYDLRHTFATELRKVADLSDVADALGHCNLSTSARYAPKQDAKVADAIAKSAIHTVLPTDVLAAQLRAMSPEERAALLAQV